ncbi:MAG: transcriptional regulator GutM [Intestinibacter sp.]|uniref:transcriptional regulator GutM n=1 Tax=Intestinibacter sp. TaxID=1965304 RepID=UPI003F13B763
MKIIIVLILLYLANFGTSYYLHKKYVESQRRVRQYGGVSTARTKGGFTKKGKIVLLAFDDEEEIIKYGEKFEGITVFSKFSEIEGIEGLTLDEVESKFADEEVIIQAVQYIRERDKDVDSEEDETDEIVENEAVEADDTTV